MKQMFEKARNAFIAESNSTIDEIALSLPRFNQIKKTLYQKKHQDMPILPRSLDLIDLVNPLYNSTSSKKRFLLYDSLDTKRFLGFSSDRQLEILSEPIDGNLAQIFITKYTSFMPG